MTCDTISINNKGMILPNVFNAKEENIHTYSILNLNRHLSILRKAPRPLRVYTVGNKAVSVKGARRKVKVKVKPRMSPKRTQAKVMAKSSPPSNPLRISDEDPETFFLHN